jgi:hypothetical protein
MHVFSVQQGMEVQQGKSPKDVLDRFREKERVAGDDNFSNGLLLET